MQIKRIISVFVFAFFVVSIINAADTEALNGIWIPKNIYDWVVNNPGDRVLNNLTMLEGRFQISWDERAQKGVFITGMDINPMNRVDISHDRIKMVYSGKEIIFKVISNDVVQVISHPYNGKYDFMYRVFDPGKPTIAKGKINNDRVRFRTKPELTSGVWYFLDNGEQVEITGRSEEKQIIGEMEDYWYEVSICVDGSGVERSSIRLRYSNMFLDGWVYGAYIDIDDKAKLENYFRKKENNEVR